MDTCYVCGKTLTDDGANGTAKRHKEHIIHNGIYGKLKSSTILCEQCGGLYSKNDAKFVELFSGFIELLREKLINKDHGSTNAKRLKGFLYLPEDEKKDIEFFDGKTYPITPYYEIDTDNKVIKIYGHKKRIIQYQNVVKKEHQEYNDYAVELCEDISTLGTVGLFFSEGNAEFNMTFREGLCKIATEFALDCNVRIEDMPYTLKKGENNTAILKTESAMVVPYMPHSAAEMTIALMEDYVVQKYPLHKLRLYTETAGVDDCRSLVCYIELFSTFKYFVLLNDDYKGNDIDKWYCQTIISEDNLGSNPVKPFLDIKTVLKEMRDRTYIILSTYIKTKKLPEVLFDTKSISRIIEDTIAEEGLEQFIREILGHLSVDNYMKTTVYHYEDAEPSFISLIGQCHKTPIDKARYYTFFKFNQLDRFCWNYNKIIEARNKLSMV